MLIFVRGSLLMEKEEMGVFWLKKSISSRIPGDHKKEQSKTHWEGIARKNI